MHRFWVAALFLALGAPGVSSGADIADLQLALEEDGIYVSFGIRDAFPDEVVERIRSGLETSFTVKIRVDQEREFWFNRRIRERELRLSCTYNSIAATYRVTKSLDGNVIDSVVVDTEAGMMASMSSLHQLKVLDNRSLIHDADYILKVKGELIDRYVLLVVPWDIETPWRQKKFTFN